MDELAHAAGQDPLEFRRKLHGQAPAQPRRAERGGRAHRLGQACAAGHLPRDRADEGVQQLRRGGGRDLGDDGGNKVKVHRIVAATDPGYAVNPAQIERQIAGSFVYGLSALFMQECTVKDGRIEQRTSTTTTRCASRRCRRWSRSSCRPAAIWGGIGEPTICVAAPAVLNAYFCGDRQAHPLGAAEEPRHRDGLNGVPGPAAAGPGRSPWSSVRSRARCAAQQPLARYNPPRAPRARQQTLLGGGDETPIDGRHSRW